MPPHMFFWKPWLLRLTLGDKRITLSSPKSWNEIYPQNLSTQYWVVWGSKNSKEEGWAIQISQKEKIF